MGVSPDWDELKETLISVGMKTLQVTQTYNTEEFKNIDWSFIKEAQEQRFRIKERMITWKIN